MQIQDLPEYRMIRKIPKGGLTDLYVCQDPSTDKRVVVRFIREQFKKDRAMRKSFNHGLDILAKLDHPNIVKIIKSGKINRLPFMVIEYHESENLRECILHRNPVAQAHSLTFVRQLASALTYLHAQGYLHMDLKPENILVKPSIELVLIDFDLAIPHRGNRPIRMRTLPGTPTYLAPETLRNMIVTDRSEVFTFGVVMYELLTTHKPFEANSVGEYRRAVVDPRVKVYPLHEYRADISRKLEQVIMKCLCKDPEDRYPSMALVKRDLDALL